MFYLFGNKTINIVFYGAFVWLLLTAYRKRIGTDLLREEERIWDSKHSKALQTTNQPTSIAPLLHSSPKKSQKIKIS